MKESYAIYNNFPVYFSRKSVSTCYLKFHFVYIYLNLCLFYYFEPKTNRQTHLIRLKLLLSRGLCLFTCIKLDDMQDVHEVVILFFRKAL